jgi:hypothetical protein
MKYVTYSILILSVLFVSFNLANAFSTEVTVQHDTYNDHNLRASETVMARVYTSDEKYFIYGSYGGTRYFWGAQPMTQVDLYSVGVGTKRKLFKGLSIYAQVGYFWPKLKNSGYEEGQETYEAIGYYLHDKLAGLPDDAEGFGYRWRSIEVQSDIGGQVGLMFEKEIIKNLSISLDTSYRILGLEHDITAQKIKGYEGGSMWRMSEHVKYDGGSIGLSLKYEW